MLILITVPVNCHIMNDDIHSWCLGWTTSKLIIQLFNSILVSYPRFMFITIHNQLGPYTVNSDPNALQWHINTRYSLHSNSWSKTLYTKPNCITFISLVVSCPRFLSTPQCWQSTWILYIRLLTSLTVRSIVTSWSTYY